MPKKKATSVTAKTDKKKQSEIKFMQGLYSDFKETFGEVFGDAGDVWKKHKALVILAFIGFLIYRNKEFSIDQFVRKLESRIKSDRDW